MTRRKQPALVGLQVAFPQSEFFHFDRGDLERIVEKLNRGRIDVYAEPLIRLMERLKECGGNLKKMMDRDPELEKVVAKVCGTRWMPSNRKNQKGADLVPQPVWLEILESEPTPGGARMRPDRYAALLFHVGTLNPEWDKLAGPCARCGRYYLKNRPSQKVYCSRKCGNAATAVERTRERLRLEREDKIDRVKVAIKEWKRAKTQQDWKPWVSQKTRIDLRFLTRNFNDTGGVKPAKKEK